MSVLTASIGVYRPNIHLGHTDIVYYQRVMCASVVDFLLCLLSTDMTLLVFSLIAAHSVNV